MSSSPHPVIAIDGTAASGKSTFSRALARRLGFVYVNTGAMYRGVTWYLLEKKTSLRDTDAVSDVVLALKLETRVEEGELVFSISGVDPLPHVRDGRVNEAVSLVSQVGAVRRLLVTEQQGLALLAPLVMEGRDIGTVVFPQSPYKFFLDADAELRTGRRLRQGEKDLVLQRDQIDRQRQNSPLTCAPEALRLDSGNNTVTELVEIALHHLAALGLNSPAAP
jgi:cytidylate kinase